MMVVKPSYRSIQSPVIFAKGVDMYNVILIIIKA